MVGQDELFAISQGIARSIERFCARKKKEAGWKPKVYIGKPKSESELAKEFLEDPFRCYMTVFAVGMPEQVNEVEKLLIKALEDSKQIELYTERASENGHAEKLYVAFSEHFNSDELIEHDFIVRNELEEEFGKVFKKKEFPISLNQ